MIYIFKMLIQRLVLVLILPLSAQIAEAQFLQKAQDASDKAIRLLKIYDLEGYQIAKAFFKTPDAFNFNEVKIRLQTEADIKSYIDSSDHWSLGRSLNTVVHELAHVYTHKRVFQYMKRNKTNPKLGEQFSLFYLGKKEDLLVKHTPTFPSAELSKSLADSLKTFRYHTYIYPTSKLSTQTVGIYGLLDEWHGYYWGTRNAHKMIPYYKHRDSDNEQRWFHFFAGINSTYLAYVEFKLFILHYLLHAEQHHPDIFLEIMDNEAFVQAYHYLDQAFGDMLKDHFAFKKKLLQDMMMAGVTCGEDDEMIYIGPWGQTNFLAEYKRLEKVLGEGAYAEMQERLATLISENDIEE